MAEASTPADGGQGTTQTAAPADSTAAQVAAPAATTPPAAAPVAWLTGADETTVGYAQNKGWTEPKQVLESYRNLEKLLGADKAGNAVILPKPDATPEERAAFFNRLGRPADATGYKITVPEAGGSQEFATAAGAKFHELGLTAAQGEALSAWYNEQATGGQTQIQAQRTQQFDADNAALKTEWGAAHAQNVLAAQTAARGLGLDAATIDKLSDALGHKGTMQLLQKIGSKVGEAPFVSADSNQAFSGALTPGQAKDQIRTNMADKNFVSRYLSKDATAVSEMKRLHEYAYPEGN